MARIGTVVPAFSSGEISPRLYGRTDIAKYQGAAEAIENFIVRPEGGLMRRHGTRFAGENFDHSKKPLLVPFVFSTIQAYMLAFEDTRIRFYKDRAPITSSTKNITGITNANPAVVTSNAHGFSNGDRVLIVAVGGMGQVNNREHTVANVTANTFELSGINSTGYDVYTSGGTASKIYTVTSPYLEADLPNLSWCQSADTLYLTHPSYAPRTLTRTADTSWTLTTTDLSKGPFAPLNTDDSARILCVAASGYQPGDPVSLQSNTAIFTANHVGSYFRLQELYLDALAVSPWAAGNPGNNAVGTQCSYNGNVYEIRAANGTNYGLVAPVHTSGEAYDNPAVGTSSYRKWRYLHSRWAIVKIDTFTDSKNVSGTIITYLCNGLAPAALAITNVTNSGDATALCRVTSAAHGLADGDYVTIAGVTGATQANGDWKIKNVATNTFDLIGSSAPAAFVGGGTGAKRFATWLWQFGAFSTDRGYPAAVALHEQRLAYANTTKQPFGLWASRTGDYTNFYPGTSDSDPIAYNIAANQVDPIRWLASASDLVLGTLAQEFAAYGGGLGNPITPSNTRIVPQSGEGSNGVNPVKVGTDVLFCNRAGRKVFALRYATEGNAYAASDLLELAEHLATTSKQIVHVAWAKNPASLLWALLTDGTLIACTYRPDQQLIAWHRHPLSDGTVESIAVIPSTDGTTDDLYAVINRTVNGATRRYVEYLAPPFEPTSPTDKSTMGFLDCALQYSGASTTTLSGLTHLEGKTVRVVGNGALQGDKVVTNGKITLDAAITQGWVGLGYTSRIRTTRLEGSAQVTAQNKTGRVPALGVLVHNSIGGTAGPGSEAVLDELVRRDQAHAMDASPPLQSGWVDIMIASEHDVDKRIAIVQSDPLPLDILALAPLQSTQER